MHFHYSPAAPRPRSHWPPPLKWPATDSCTNNLNSITALGVHLLQLLQQQTICRPHVPGLTIRSHTDRMELLELWKLEIFRNTSQLTVACLIRRLYPPFLVTKEDIYQNLSGNSCRVIKYKYFYFLTCTIITIIYYNLKPKSSKGFLL